MLFFRLKSILRLNIHTFGSIIAHRLTPTQMIDLIDFHVERSDDVMMDQLEVLVAKPMLDVALVTGEKVIRHNNLVTLHHQHVHQMTADEAGASGHQNSLYILVRQVFHFWVALDWRFSFQALDPRLQFFDARFQVVILADHIFQIVVVQVDASSPQIQRSIDEFDASRTVVE